MAATGTYHHSDNAEVYRTNASFVFNDENTRAVLELLDPKPGDVILDVGCGSGELTLKLHRLVHDGGAQGRVVGVDVSSDMIRAAEAHSGASGLRYGLCDGHDLEQWLQREGLTGTFDKVFSSAALHWMKSCPAAVVQGMHAALRSDGRGVLAIEMGGHMNCLAVRSSLHTALRQRNIEAQAFDPWYFPTAESYSAQLQSAGFQVQTAYIHPRPTKLPQGTGFVGWLRTFAGPFLNAVPGEVEREAVLGDLQEQLKIDMYDEETDQWTLMCEMHAGEALMMKNAGH